MSEVIRNFGLIGATLKHSFSKDYFSNKFKNEGITNCIYQLYELESIQEFSSLITKHSFAGLNVTIPYKLEVMPFLTSLDSSAQKVGAVNVIKFRQNGEIIGFNSDYYGFKTSLRDWVPKSLSKALILGTGGASKAVKAVLTDLNISFTSVSRNASADAITYDDLFNSPELMKESKLIINTTPLGMHPNITARPSLNYSLLTTHHYLYDLVYNPETTFFMQSGIDQSANVKNGHEMLILQAEKSWDIWNS